MRSLLLILLIGIGHGFNSFAQTPTTRHDYMYHWGNMRNSEARFYASTITAEDLSRHLHVLASDSLEGRETGQPGQKKAARYLAATMQKMGVAPGFIGKDGAKSYFQEFTLLKKSWDKVSLSIGEKEKFFLEDFYIYGDFNLPASTKMETVYLGYGIDAPKYSDYKIKNKKGGTDEINIKDKAVVILNGDPMVDGKSLVTGSSSSSEWAYDWRKKAAYAYTKGAKLVIIISGKNQSEFNTRLAQLKEHLKQPTLGFSHKLKTGSAFFIPMSMAAEIFGVTEENFTKYREFQDKNYTAATPVKNKIKLKPQTITASVLVKEEQVNTENVLGFIEGSDKKDEIIVITAHYDHLGIEGDKICYGADDDGSGTAALLEIAEAFMMAKKEGHGPRRSILIMPVTAEEKGLMGSEYYTDFPVYPINNTVADLNIDMIGRIDEAHIGDTNYVYLIGSDRLSKELHEISEYANEISSPSIKLDYTFNSNDDPNRFYYRSDHYNFAKNNIPVIFYFSGVHEDYHKPTDTVDKILFRKAANITRLVFVTAWMLANSENRIELTPVK